MNILGWAIASQTKALENARVAAIECSRRMVERAEVAQAVAELTAAYSVPRAVSAAPRDVSLRATAR